MRMMTEDFLTECMLDTDYDSYYANRYIAQDRIVKARNLIRPSRPDEEVPGTT